MPPPRDTQRSKAMEQWLREAQGFAIYLRLGVLSISEVRDFLREQYGLKLPELPDDFEPPEIGDDILPAIGLNGDYADPAELLAHLGAAPVEDAPDEPLLEDE